MFRKFILSPYRRFSINVSFPLETAYSGNCPEKLWAVTSQGWKCIQYSMSLYSAPNQYTVCFHSVLEWKTNCSYTVKDADPKPLDFFPPFSLFNDSSGKDKTTRAITTIETKIISPSVYWRCVHAWSWSHTHFFFHLRKREIMHVTTWHPTHNSYCSPLHKENNQ